MGKGMEDDTESEGVKDEIVKTLAVARRPIVYQASSLDSQSQSRQRSGQ